MNWFELWKQLTDHDAIKIMRVLRAQASLAGDIPFDYRTKFTVTAAQVLARGYGRESA